MVVVGDTYVLGTEFPNTIVFNNELKHSPNFNKYYGLGIYKENFDIDNLMNMINTFNNNHKISDKYLKVIKYHSILSMAYTQ